MSAKGEQTRTRILKEAGRLIWRKGFSGTSIGDILSAAGIHKGSLYFHFQSKEQIVHEILHLEQTRFLNFLDNALQGASPAECLDNFFAAVIETHRQRNFIGGCLWGNTALEASDFDPPLALKVDQVFASWQRRLETTLTAGQRSREFRNDLPAPVLAQLIVTAAEGAIMLARLRKSAQPLEDCFSALRQLVSPGQPPPAA